MHARLQGGDENTGWTCGDCGELNPKFAHIAEGSGVNGVNPTKQHEDQALLKWKPFFLARRPNSRARAKCYHRWDIFKKKILSEPLRILKENEARYIEMYFSRLLR